VLCSTDWLNLEVPLPACSCPSCSQGNPNPAELPIIKLLLRELEVAVAEEDYTAAARLRDHPYLRMAVDIDMFSKLGYSEKAREQFRLLKAQIEANESRDGEEYAARVERLASGASGGQLGLGEVHRERE